LRAILVRVPAFVEKELGHTVRGIANPALDYEEPHTPRAAAAEQQKTMHLELGTLVENNSREFSVLIDGREVAVIQISDAPAWGLVATTTASCPTQCPHRRLASGGCANA